jgi:hypothetical protein
MSKERRLSFQISCVAELIQSQTAAGVLLSRARVFQNNKSNGGGAPHSKLWGMQGAAAG